MDATEQRFEDIRQWLRFHSGYGLSIDPWSLYRCWRFTFHGPHGEQVSQGTSLGQRLAEVEQWMAAIDPELVPGRPYFPGMPARAAGQ